MVGAACVMIFVALEIMFTRWAFSDGSANLFFVWIIGSFILLVGCTVPALFLSNAADERKLAAMEPAERAKYLANKEKNEARRTAEYKAAETIRNYGGINSALLCPHCQTKGYVRMTQATRITKNRVNSVAGKAIGLGTNSESQVTQLHCDKCSMTWDA